MPSGPPQGESRYPLQGNLNIARSGADGLLPFGQGAIIVSMASASNRYDPASWIIKADATLVDIDPEISRTLEFPRNLNLAELHELLQAEFDWESTHLHQFEIGGLTYGAPDPAHEEHVATRKWTGRRFDPELFDLTATNRAIASAMRQSKGTYRHRRLKR